MRTVTVTGQGRTTAVPDTATLAVAVSVREGDVATAYARVGDLAGQARSVALRHVRDADLATAGISLWQFHDESATGYEATHRFTVRCGDLSVVSALLDALAGEVGDALRVDDVSLRVGDESAALVAAREAAFADARRTAEHLAGLAGCALGDVQQVGEGHSGAVPRGAMMAVRADSVSPGEASVDAALTVTWELLGG